MSRLNEADLVAPESPRLASRILEAIGPEHRGLRMDYWHSRCGTKHCIAGWAVVRAYPNRPCPNFVSSNNEAIAWLEETAKLDGPP